MEHKTILCVNNCIGKPNTQKTQTLGKRPPHGIALRRNFSHVGQDDVPLSAQDIRLRATAICISLKSTQVVTSIT
jgi:hypothetical protein